MMNPEIYVARLLIKWKRLPTERGKMRQPSYEAGGGAVFLSCIKKSKLLFKTSIRFFMQARDTAPPPASFLNKLQLAEYTMRSLRFGFQRSIRYS